MFAPLAHAFSTALLCALLTAACFCQETVESNSREEEPAAPSQLISLPLDRFIRSEAGIPPVREMSAKSLPEDLGTSIDFKRLLRPRFGISAEWAPMLDDFALASYDASVKMPLFPVFGPPPPFVNAGYTFTDIAAPLSWDIPSSLHEFSVGLAWIRPINDRWTSRFTVISVYATDLHNTSSEAWQLRAGGFAMYQPNEQWSLAVGALATGRQDIPVLPAAGLVWQPNPKLKLDLMLPNPRIAHQFAKTEKRVHWGYVGGGISGGTWAYLRNGGIPDRLNYREWRLVAGWESTPPRLPGTFIPSSNLWNAEVGFVFGREFEFDSENPSISLDNGLLIRTGLRF